ncbi:FAD-dependent oxidoreductase [Agrobacterium tumefaciens]|uniref:FAD-dependent oxidoreductase n=1 Tax=Agrobacterium tumefaciens TaxID=358 RepID=UPI00287C4D31|nr:FAD-dependent oxidoreductase [Agrobacterium tumefaciens]MDS7595403.1 FAD-dependent oxidoreductase [Agrobacterium tumefaciens]
MTGTEHFDLVVFGGGKAGKTLAMDKARAGLKVAVVEEGMIGGSCINIACIPSKTLIRSAEVAHNATHVSPFGTRTSAVSIDISVVAARTAAVVAEMVEFNQAGFDASGLELVIGRGAFVGSRTIEVTSGKGKRTIAGDKVFINLGTVADVPDVTGLKDAKPLTHVEALKLKELPQKLVVLGGGFIALELGQAFARLGSDVTIVERNGRLAGREDADFADAILAAVSADGVKVEFNSVVKEVRGKSGVTVELNLADGRRIDGTHLLVATGRRPRTANIGLDLAGVSTDKKGFIVVDERLRTTAPNVWAMGEVAGTPMFTHASLDDYRVVKSDLEGGSRTTKGRLIPYCVFVAPEYARVGTSETEMLNLGLPYRVAKLPLDVVPRARTLSERAGFMKAVISAKDDQILGFSMLGVNAGDVMSVVHTAMLGNLPFTALRDAIFAHPTISEGLNMLFAKVVQPT